VVYPSEGVLEVTGVLLYNNQVECRAVADQKSSRPVVNLPPRSANGLDADSVVFRKGAVVGTVNYLKMNKPHS
jgi:hypothetical protein